MNVELKNLKIAKFASEETLCFDANIYIDGRKVGNVSNEGRGGSCRIFIVDPEDHRTLNLWAADLGLDEYRPVPGADGATLTEHLSDVLMEMASNQDELKRMTRLCKTNTLFRLTGSGRGWMQVKVPYSPEVAERLRKKYAPAGEEIVFLNDDVRAWLY